MKSTIRITLSVIVLSIVGLWIWAQVENYLAYQRDHASSAAVEMPLEQKFATVSVGHLVPPGDPDVARSKDLLSRASATYAITQETVADQSVAAANAAKEHGAKVSAIEVLEAATLVGIKGSIKFHEACAMYVALRDTMSHAEAVVSLNGINKLFADGYARGK